jgi:hypothetical protein
VYVHLARLLPFQSRKLKRALEHLARFWQDIPGDDRDRIDAVLLCIEQEIFSIWRWFNKSVDFLADGTGCVRSTEPPSLKRGHLEVTLQNCRRDRIRCRIHKFFEENRSLFQAMIGEIQSLEEKDRSKELRTLEQITASASADSKVLCDDRVCRKVGDALIGIDSKGFPELISSNSKEFRVICNAVGNALVTIRPS